MDSHKGSSTHPQKHHQSSSSDLMSSAKYLAEVAQNTLHHETDKIDKGRAAGAAADVLDAASHYGKLEGKGVGNYIDKAETYLHQYHSSHSVSTTDSGHGHSTTTTTTTHESSSHKQDNEGDGNSGSGYGEYFKMAQGFMKDSGHGHSTTSTTTTHESSSHKQDNEGDGNSGSGYGEYFKMAEGFLKKY